MSENWLRVIPTDADWQPDESSARRALTILKDVAPKAQAYEAERYDKFTFIDPGAELVSVGCPHCGGPVDLGWFAGLMDSPTFESLTEMTPCCSRLTSLNDLDFEAPAGFARFELTALNPDIEALQEGELKKIEAALGHTALVVWTRY